MSFCSWIPAKEPIKAVEINVLNNLTDDDDDHVYTTIYDTIFFFSIIFFSK